MSTTPEPTWRDNLTAIEQYAREHGRLPSPQSTDPEVQRLAAWWLEQHLLSHQGQLTAEDVLALSEVVKNMPHRGDLDPDQAAAVWQQKLTALRAYTDAHEGRFPTTRDPDPDVAALGSWWVQQNIALTKARLTGLQRLALANLTVHARALRDQVHAARLAEHASAARSRARETARRAGREAAAAARKALDNPHLIPGDREILQLRIDNPELTVAEVAAVGGMTAGQFATKFRGALNRTPSSSSPLPKDDADRMFEPAEAAALVGVPSVVLGRWNAAGLLSAQRSGRGGRRYLGADLLRVKKQITGGWPAEFVEKAKDRRGRLPAGVDNP